MANAVAGTQSIETKRDAARTRERGRAQRRRRQDKRVSELTRREVGLVGEDIATAEYERQGIEVYARNWRSHFGEADIIALDGSTAILCEVKTRVVYDPNDPPIPELAVGPAKQDRYRKMACEFIATYRNIEEVRFDVMGIDLMDGREPVVTFLPNAFGWDE